MPDPTRPYFNHPYVPMWAESVKLQVLLPYRLRSVVCRVSLPQEE